jgi:hypothetical protein
MTIDNTDDVFKELTEDLNSKGGGVTEAEIEVFQDLDTLIRGRFSDATAGLTRALLDDEPVAVVVAVHDLTDDGKGSLSPVAILATNNIRDRLKPAPMFDGDEGDGSAPVMAVHAFDDPRGGDAA